MSTSTQPTRRVAMGTLAAALWLSPARAVDWGAVADRAARFDQIRSIVVGLDGDVVLARAIRGPRLDRPANVKSVSKSILATLAGIAFGRGLLDGPRQSLAAIIPDRIPPGADPRVADITLDHLMTMTAGLERTSGQNYGAWVASADWVADALGRPMVDAPGGRFLYSTGSFHLLGAALARATGRSLLELSNAWIGQPLGIRFVDWVRDPQGLHLGGNDMALSPLDLWRFGEMWRRGGVWEGSRVVPEAWVRTSWVPRTRSPFSGDAYGYGWFLGPLAGPGGRWPMAYGRGFGGQMVYVVPDLRLTVAITSDPNRPARSAGHAGDLRRLLGETIAPLAR